MTADFSGHGSQRSGGSTSQSLLAEARLSVPAAWERLVRLYSPLAASWCRRSGVAEQDVGDVLQEVFSAVANHLDNFRKDRSGDTFRGWLRTITRNKVHDYFRRRANEPNALGGSEASWQFQQVADQSLASELLESADDESADELLFDNLLRKALGSIQGEFHEKTWQAFWGVVIEGRQTADVAADLKVKPGTVRVAKSRVLLRLRRELGEVSD